MLGVAHFGMKLDPVEAPLRIFDRRDRGRRRRAGHAEARRGLDHGVAVAHPDGLLRLEPGEELGVRREVRGRTPELAASVRAFHLSAERVRHPLHAVAEAQNGDSERARVRPRHRRSLFVDALRSAREDDPGRVPPPDAFFRLVGWEDDGEDAGFADPPRDQLRVLATEVEDDDGAAAGAHASPMRISTAAGAARTRAGTSAKRAPRKGVSATRTGVTSAPGA